LEKNNYFVNVLRKMGYLSVVGLWCVWYGTTGTQPVISGNFTGLSWTKTYTGPS